MTPSAPAQAPPRALFWSYDLALPSFRHRLAPVAEALRRRGWRCDVERLPRGRYICRILERRRRTAESTASHYAALFPAASDEDAAG